MQLAPQFIAFLAGLDGQTEEGKAWLQLVGEHTDGPATGADEDDTLEERRNARRSTL